MEQSILIGALVHLSERLMTFDHRIGEYCGHVCSGKGITLKTSTVSLFLYPIFIYKLLNNPETVTDDELKDVALNIHQA